MQMGTSKSEFCISDFFGNEATSSNPDMSDFLKKASKFFSGSNGKKKEHKKAREKGCEENEEDRKENDGNKEEKEVQAVNAGEENSEKWGKKLKNRGKLFVGGLNPGTTAQNLEVYFSRFGKVVDSVVMRCPKTSKSRGFGFVTFADPANAERALQGNHTLDGRVIETRPFGKKKAENRVFLGNLPQSAKENDLKEFFARFGEVTSVDMINDKITKKPKGFAFLSFKEPEAMEKCLSESFVYIGGKRVHIGKAEQRHGSKISDDESVPDLSQVEEGSDDQLGIIYGEDAASMIDDETRSSSSGGQWSVFDNVPRFKKVFEDYMLSKTGDAEKVNDAETKGWNESEEKEVAALEKLFMDLFFNSGVDIGEEEENLIVFSTDEETTEEGTSDGDDSTSSDELDDILDGTSNRYLRATDGEFRKTFLGKGEGDCDSSRNSPNLFLRKGSLWCSLCQWQPLDGSKESFFAHCQTPDHRLKTQERFNLKQNQGSKPEAKSIFTAAAKTRSKSLEKLLIGESESEEGEKLKTKQKKNAKEPQMNQQKQPQQQLQQKRLQQDQTQQKEKQQKQVQPMKQQQKQQNQPQEQPQKPLQQHQKQQLQQHQKQQQQQKPLQQHQKQQQQQQKPLQQHQKQQQQQKPLQQHQKQQQQQQKPLQQLQKQKQQQQQNQPRKNVQQQQKQENKEHQNKKAENKEEEGKTTDNRRNISNLKIHALAKGMVSIRPLSGNLLHCTMCGKTIPQAQSFDILMKNLSQHLQSKKHLRNLSETETSLKNVLGENPKEGKDGSSIRSNNNIPACKTNRSAGKVKMETQEHSKVQGESSVGGKPQRKRKTRWENNERAGTGVGNGKKEKTEKGGGANCEKFFCLHCKFRSGRKPFRVHLKSQSHSDCLRGRGVSSDDFLNSRNVCPGCQSVLFGSLHDINQHYSGCSGV